MSKESEEKALSYPNDLFGKNELLDQKFAEYQANAQKIKDVVSKFSKANEKYVKATKMKGLSNKKPMHEMFENAVSFSKEEAQRSDEYGKINGRHVGELERLKRYIENNRKVLRRRTRKNEKNYNQNKKILENIKKKQNKSAKEAHDWFIKYDRLSNSKSHDKQELEFIEFRFIHYAQEETRFSKEYKSIARKLKDYQSDYVNENGEILRRYEEFDKVCQERIKEQYLCFIEELKRDLARTQRAVESFEERVLKYDISSHIQSFIKENENPRIELEPSQKYEPFVPIYKRSVVQQEKILKSLPNNQKKLKFPKKKLSIKNQKTPNERISPRKKELPELPASLKAIRKHVRKNKKEKKEKENNNHNKEETTPTHTQPPVRMKITDPIVEVPLHPPIVKDQPIRTTEVIWYEGFYLKLTNHDEVVSNYSESKSDFDDVEEEGEIDSQAEAEESVSSQKKENNNKNSGVVVASQEENNNNNNDESSASSSRKKKAKSMEKVEKEANERRNGGDIKDLDHQWEFGVTPETMKKAFEMLDTAVGRQGFALGLNYQRHHPYIVSQKVYEKIGELISRCLVKSMECQDKDVGKMLLNMCQTFYTIRKVPVKSKEENEDNEEKEGEEEEEEEEEKKEMFQEKEETVFYYQHLKSLSIWRDIRFWIGCFYDTMSQMRMKTVHFSQKWRDLDENKKKEAQREHANMTFGVLTSFIFQMTQAGMEEEEVKRFILKMCEINSLGQEQIAMIMLNFEEMLKNKMIPPL